MSCGWLRGRDPVSMGLMVIGSEMHRGRTSVDLRDKVYKHPGTICYEGEKGPDGASGAFSQ